MSDQKLEEMKASINIKYNELEKLTYEFKNKE